MNKFFPAVFLVFTIFCASDRAIVGQENGSSPQEANYDAPPPSKRLPSVLADWKDWVLWSDDDLTVPPLFNNASMRIRSWPSRLILTADASGAEWQLEVYVFAPAWVALPGEDRAWPVDVMVDGQPAIVMSRDGSPAIKLEPGLHKVSGRFRWNATPQKLKLPASIGLLDLTVSGNSITVPTWDEKGYVWLQRRDEQASEKEFLSAQVYRLIEDGIPMWLRTEIEITASGRSREEDLGWCLPEGWILSHVESPLPVAIDEQGRLKVQVRAGKWTIAVDSFRTDNPTEIQYASGTQPVAELEFIAFKSEPQFRLAELSGLVKIDASQTTFPEKWREFPVFQWDTSSRFQIEEKLRGAGAQRPRGLTIKRQFWLDDDGRAMTYQDHVQGTEQQIWRLDAAERHELGAVRIQGEGQLITTNPISNVPGVEIRRRNIDLEAVGRISDVEQIVATGWQTDVDSLNAVLTLPPGWRALAVFGPDSVRGDWLTSWTLLDLFLLLIFTLAVWRLFGWWAGLLAFLAFGLAYHEPGAPRFTWLLLLIPVALLRVVPPGMLQRWIRRGKYVAVFFLLVNLVPFVVLQIQQTLYPQLERPGVNFEHRSIWTMIALDAAKSASVRYDRAYESTSQTTGLARSQKQAPNLAFDPAERIQTGPAVPQWTWNVVHCNWDGPVTVGDTIRPIFISLSQHRILSVLRVVFLLLMGFVLIGSKRIFRLTRPSSAATSAAVLLIAGGLFCDSASAETIPSAELLQELRKRLLQPDDAFPIAAQIPVAELSVEGDRLTTELEIHVAADSAVPLPGKISSASPVSVTIENAANGEPPIILRKDGYLWGVFKKGVHRVRTESRLTDPVEWEWSYVLRPHRVIVDAPDWNVAGVDRDGVPGQQVIFVRQQKTDAGEAVYDRKNFNAIVLVERHFEIGLVWRLRTRVTRLSQPGRAVSLQIPLIEGENVLSQAVINDRMIEVRLGSSQRETEWTSELVVGQDVSLIAPATNQWVERWRLISSPVWNVSYSGLKPTFDVNTDDLVAVWSPWPGERVNLTFNKPTPIQGATLTVKRVERTVTLSTRQQVTELNIDVESSQGDDFPIQLYPGAEISTLHIDGEPIPPHVNGNTLMVPVRPGIQQVKVTWTENKLLPNRFATNKVTLPVETANITTAFHIPDSRWILWANGPLQGPAVRFWTVLTVALLLAIVLGSLRQSPLRRIEWALFALGLTQINIFAALLVVGWLFALARRGRKDGSQMSSIAFNFQQIALAFWTMVSLIILIVIVGQGLLGHPDMFIQGNGSSRRYLQWFQARAGTELPHANVFSVSVWYYRLLMLFWALWLANALLRWLRWGWQQYSNGGIWKRAPRIISAEALPNE